MLAGGIGAIRPGHVLKAPVPEGAALIVLGGPGFLIGLGGGAASSVAQGATPEELDFASVRRDNAELERRCQEVIDRCWAMGDRNPILSIHDVGAGGLSNAMPELVHDAGLGARLELRAIPTGEPDLSPLELWCNEAQERYVLAIATDRVAEFAALCTRERAPWAQLGTATADGRLVVADGGARRPVDVPLELILGKAPRMTRRAEPFASPRFALELGGASLAEALDRVLGLPAVADKTFLVTIGDRTVGGMVSRRFDDRAVPGAGRRLRRDDRRLRRLRGRGDGDRRASAGRIARCGGGLATRDRRGGDEPRSGADRAARS